MENMTALVSAFARAHHYKNNDTWVFADSVAEQLLTPEEYAGIAAHMADGISFFAPGFQGTREAALRFVVDHQLAPSVLARSAYCERAIERAVAEGCNQVVVFACGYDTFSLRADDAALSVYELDRPEMIEDRRARLERSGLRPACRVEAVGCDLSRPSWREALLKAGFRQDAPAFGSLLGISYYLTSEAFRSLIGGAASLWRAGSLLCFDYPMSEGGARSERTRALATAAGERMQARYTFEEMEALLSDAGFEVRGHMDAREATEALFTAYNRANPEHAMTAPEGVGYCLAKKTEKGA